ncbi:hypothetical protein [Streptomyces olivaceus]|uniref:hypothetical protein n=1 Tax=Streptomyces olivaceus TaxID=47716 RepID=UPI00371CE189
MPHDPDRYRREAAALERLTRRHGGERYRQLNAYGGPYLTVTPIEAVNLVISALHRDTGDVTGEDLDDALLLLGRAREELDSHELELVDRARLQHGRTWKQVGEAVAGDADRRTAQTRYSRLRDRTPGYAPPAPHQEAATT